MVMVAQLKDKKQLRKKIHQAVCQMYEAVSLRPNDKFHFPVGRSAALSVGYPTEVLKNIPAKALESFAGVAYHFQNGVIKQGDAVLDIGSGSGTDLLIAAGFVGPSGKVIGVDITSPMVEKAKLAIQESGLDNVSAILTKDEKLPFNQMSFDVVISNGVINLVHDKLAMFKGIFRVLKPGGALSIADIVLGEAISEQSRQNPALWAECVVGASLENRYIDMIKRAGFSKVKVVTEIDYFAASPSENTRNVAERYKAHAVVIKAIK